MKQADVGAIYLGNANTEFSLKDENNNLNGQIRKTGIYLKESTGAAGTIAHRGGANARCICLAPSVFMIQVFFFCPPPGMCY